MKRLQASGPAPGGRKMAEGERQSPPGRERRAGPVAGVGAGKRCGAGGSAAGGLGDGRTRNMRVGGPRVEGPCGRSDEGTWEEGKNSGQRRGSGWVQHPDLGSPGCPGVRWAALGPKGRTFPRLNCAC